MHPGFYSDGRFPKKDMKPCTLVVTMIYKAMQHRLKAREENYNRGVYVIGYFDNLYDFFSRPSDSNKNYGVLTSNKKVKKYQILNQVFEFES
jgi:hypothetical protein